MSTDSQMLADLKSSLSPRGLIGHRIRKSQATATQSEEMGPWEGKAGAEPHLCKVS